MLTKTLKIHRIDTLLVLLPIHQVQMLSIPIPKSRKKYDSKTKNLLRLQLSGVFIYCRLFKIEPIIIQKLWAKRSI